MHEHTHSCLPRFFGLLTTFILFVCLVSLPCQTALAQIYKYQDARGKWVFSDKKPIKTPDIEVETVKIENKVKKKIQPYIFTDTREENGQHYNLLMAVNPYFAPVQMRVFSDQLNNGKKTRLVSANSVRVFLKTKKAIAPFRYKWAIGNPKAKHDNSRYAIPVRSGFAHRISQSFNGKFSHFGPANKYAVDIGMKIGTHLVAARAGRVIWTKDDYHMSGRTKYFLDKANYVKVLHEDGTYAVYAHILQGTLAVKPGDYVEVGQLLARSGSSGFSTGPHLHFVIRRNAGMKSLAVPFEFSNDKGKNFTPKRGMKVRGFKP